MLISETTGMLMTAFFSEVQFAGGHPQFNNQFQVIKDIYNGLAECGGTYEYARATLADEYPDVNDVVHVMSYTEYIPTSPWVIRMGLDPADVQKLIDGIIAVAGTPDGEKALQALLGTSHTGVETINDAEYDLLRDIVKTFGLQLNNCSDMYLPLVTHKNGN